MTENFSAYLMPLALIILAYILFFVLLLVSKLIKRFYIFAKNKSLKNLTVIKNDNVKVYAFIVSYFLTDQTAIVHKQGSIGNLHYTLYRTSNDVIIYRIELDFNTDSHIVGFSNKCQIDRLSFENYLLINDMENIKLEGNFSDKIEIYSDKLLGSKTHYIIDPEVMGFLIDSLGDDFWEISDNDLYVAYPTGDHEGKDHIREIAKLIDQIRPAFYKTIKRKMTDQNSYGGYDDKEYKCPICTKLLIRKKYWLECPDYDGIAINGGYIVKINNDEIQPPNYIAKPKPHGVVGCPNCHNEMQSTPYQNGKIIIDSCVKCPMRWLDSGEVNKLN